LAIADGSHFDIETAFKTGTEQNPFATLGDPSFAGVWTAGLMARVPVDGKHLALIAAH
jgi:hypothetical protein